MDQAEQPHSTLLSESKKLQDNRSDSSSSLNEEDHQEEAAPK